MAQLYIIVAGPQAAGKSSSIEYMQAKYQSLISLQNRQEFGSKIPFYAPDGPEMLPTNIILYQEMRALVVRENKIKGGIFMDWAEESEVIDRDIARLDETISKEDNRVYIDETNIFTLAHAGRHNVLIKPSYERYMKRLRQLNTVILFLDINKMTSWERRSPSYMARVANHPEKDREIEMNNFLSYLDLVYPRLYDIYDLLPFPKRMINTETSIEQTEEDVTSALEQMIKSQGISLINRIVPLEDGHQNGNDKNWLEFKEFASQAK
jgi:hypothetical protein